MGKVRARAKILKSPGQGAGLEDRGVLSLIPQKRWQMGAAEFPKPTENHGSLLSLSHGKSPPARLDNGFLSPVTGSYPPPPSPPPTWLTGGDCSWSVCPTSLCVRIFSAAQVEAPFYEEWWFLLVMALSSLIVILLVVFALVLHGQNKKYKNCSTGAGPAPSSHVPRCYSTKTQRLFSRGSAGPVSAFPFHLPVGAERDATGFLSGGSQAQPSERSTPRDPDADPACPQITCVSWIRA